MPAPKPSSLIERHETAAEKAERDARESVLTPKSDLPRTAPARLKDHAVAAAAWRRLMRVWDGVDGVIVTRLDEDLLVDYCLMLEQVGELDTMRKTAYDMWLKLAKQQKDVETEGDEKRDEALALAIEVVGAFDAVIKLDARGERKRAHLQKLRESLYLTPRARAGAAPKRKEKTDEDPFDKFLNDLDDEQ